MAIVIQNKRRLVAMHQAFQVFDVQYQIKNELSTKKETLLVLLMHDICSVIVKLQTLAKWHLH